MIQRNDIRRAPRRALFATASWLVLLVSLNATITAAQEQSVPIDASEIQSVMNAEPPEAETAPRSAPSGIDLLTLITRGGVFMIPIAVMSLLVVALAVERFLNLRRHKIIPRLLVEDLEELTDPIDRFNPTSAHQSCADQPSPAARVISAMLMRTGQPMADIEHAATEAIEREADKYASPIRWLNFAAAATPLMGLLGTVWGMIVAFHESTTLTPDRSRSEQLSEGIYTALVTTLAGLIVAIPAAMLALYLENRLASMFHNIEELAFNVAPGLRRFAGKQRMDADGVLHPIDGVAPPPADVPQPPPPPRPAKQTRGSKVG